MNHVASHMKNINFAPKYHNRAANLFEEQNLPLMQNVKEKLPNVDELKIH